MNPSSPGLLFVGRIFFKFIYFWLNWVFIASLGFSLLAAGRGYLVVMHRLLIVGASFAGEHRL